MTSSAHPIYHERLWASPWIFVTTALVIPACLAVFLPINLTAGVIVAIMLYAAIVVALIIGSPTVEIADGELRAGRAHLPLGLVGEVIAYRGDEASLQRGQKLDARAWLLIRGWISPLVRIEISDPDDPTPYWIVSSRTPEALVGAITGATTKA